MFAPPVLFRTVGEGAASPAAPRTVLSLRSGVPLEPSQRTQPVGRLAATFPYHIPINPDGASALRTPATSIEVALTPPSTRSL